MNWLSNCTKLIVLTVAFACSALQGAEARMYSIEELRALSAAGDIAPRRGASHIFNVIALEGSLKGLLPAYKEARNAQSGNTPLIEAVTLGSMKAVRQILAHDVDIEARNKTGKSALEEVFLIRSDLHESPRIFEYLIIYGANVTPQFKIFDAIDRNGKPLDFEMGLHRGFLIRQNYRNGCASNITDTTKLLSPLVDIVLAYDTRTRPMTAYESLLLQLSCRENIGRRHAELKQMQNEDQASYKQREQNRQSNANSAWMNKIMKLISKVDE